MYGEAVLVSLIAVCSFELLDRAGQPLSNRGEDLGLRGAQPAFDPREVAG